MRTRRGNGNGNTERQYGNGWTGTSRRMRRKGYFGSSGKNLTSPFTLQTSISYNRGKTLFWEYIFAVSAISLERVRRNSVNSTSGPKNTTIDVQRPRFLTKGQKIVAILQHDKRIFGIFSLHMRRNGYSEASGQKCDHAIRSGDLDFVYSFPLPGDVYAIYLIFIVLPLRATFDLLTLTLFLIRCLTSSTHTPILITMRLPVTELWITEFDHIFVSGNSHGACAVRWAITHISASVVKATTQVDRKGQNSTPRHTKTLWQTLTKIGVGDNIVDVTRHAKFYRAPFRGFCSPYTWFSVPPGVTF